MIKSHKVGERHDVDPNPSILRTYGEVVAIVFVRSLLKCWKARVVLALAQVGVRGGLAQVTGRLGKLQENVVGI